MISKQAANLTILVLLSELCSTLLFAGDDKNVAGTEPVAGAEAVRPATDINLAAPRPLNQLPISPVSSLTRELALSQSNSTARVEGTVLDQGLGEYVILQDQTGTIRVETHQTTPIGGGELATAWGRLSWDGTHVFLRDASFRPLAWDSVAEQRIVAAPGKPDQLPRLTQVRQVRDLAPSQAAWQYPVRVRGVVTTIWRDYRALFVQDDSAGIFVSATNLNVATELEVGDQVDVEGVSGPGGYAPIIESAAVEAVGRGNLPEGRLVTLYQMATGQFDSQWVEVRGVVRSVYVGRRSVNLQIGDINGLVEVDIPLGTTLTNLVDSLVRVRGICCSRTNPNRQLTGVYIWSPAASLLVVEEEGAIDPFTLPAQPVASLSEFAQRRATQHRLKIAGVVTFSHPGRPMYVQDETGGVPVFLAQPANAKPGDRVEVVGYLSPSRDFGYEFRNASCRVTGHTSVPTPVTVPSTGLLNQTLHGRWVVMDARLVSSSRRGAEDVLTLQAESQVVEAIRPGDIKTQELLPPPGSLLRLHGVYSILGDESRMPRALRLFVPAMEPIRIVEKASWWNAQHAATVLGIMAVTVLAAVLWAVTLRRRVREQTLIIRERLAKEASLQERFREIFEGANDLIFTLDLDGRLTSLNPAGQHALGYTFEEVEQLAVDQVLAPGSRGLGRKLLELKPANGNVTTCDCEFVARDGRHLLVETSLRLTLKDGKPHSIQAIGRDITERRQMEEKLRESEVRYRRLVDLSPTAIYVQCEGRVTFINQTALQLLGASCPKEVLGKTVLELIHPDFREAVAKRIAQLRDSVGSVPLLDEKYLRLDGSIVEVEVAAASFILDGKPAVQVILHDITERKRAETALEEASSLLQTLLDNCPDCIYFKDRQSRFVRYSNAFVKLFRVPDGDSLRGKTDFDFFLEQHARPAYEDEQQIIRTGKPLIGKLEKELHPDGRVTWALTTKLPWRDKEGAIIGTFGISKDVTAIKEAEEKLASEEELLRTLLDNSPDCIYFKDRQSRFIRYSNAFVKLFKVPDGESLRGKTDFDFFSEQHARPAYEDEQQIISTGRPLIGKLEQETHPDGHVTWALTTKMPWRNKDGNIIGTFGISKDVTAIKEAEVELAYERELFQSMLDYLPDYIYFKDLESRFVRISKSKAKTTLPAARSLYLAKHSSQSSNELPPHLSSAEAFARYLIGKTDFDTFDEQFARQAFEEEQAIIRTGVPLIGKLEHTSNPDGSAVWKFVTKMPWRDKNGNITGTFGVSRDITSLKAAEVQLEAVNRRLIETSRLAGMAEVATDVLHNVGNVLNSVNVSCSLSIERVKTSKVSSVSKIASLVQENRERLADFFTQDPRGQQIPSFLAALSEHLTAEQTSLLNELEQMVKHIDHIKQIVAMQQSYAKVAGVIEPVSPAQLVDDALHINAAALLRHDVQVCREFQETPQIMTDRHKALQILVNLISNAKYATDEAQRPDKLLTVKVATEADGNVRIQVIDNGVGIPNENLTRIFSHGFTTRRDGHGFGLHSSALAVKDLGGSLEASSDGPGKGAVFTLVLPHAPPTLSHESV